MLADRRLDPLDQLLQGDFNVYCAPLARFTCWFACVRSAWAGPARLCPVVPNAPQVTRRISYGIRIDELSAPEAAGRMVVDDTDGLHPGIDDRWPDELEAAPFHLLGDPLRQG
jgi:hypothetical protein